MAGFVKQRQNKPRRLNNLSTLALREEEVGFVQQLLNKLSGLDLSVCKDAEPLRGIVRYHYVEKKEKVYVYEYYEVERYGEIIFRAKLGSNEEKIARKLVLIHNVIAEACSKLPTLIRELTMVKEFVQQLQNKPKEVT